MLLLLLGLLGPRLALLLFWYFRPANRELSSCSDSEGENASNNLTVFRVGTWTGCALLTADAMGMAVPCILFFQVRSEYVVCI